MACFDLLNRFPFRIIDKSNSKLHLKIKEASHISWKKHNLNTQQINLTVTLSL